MLWLYGDTLSGWLTSISFKLQTSSICTLVKVSSRIYKSKAPESQQLLQHTFMLFIEDIAQSFQNVSLMFHLSGQALLHGVPRGLTYPTKLYTGRLCPEVQSPTPYITFHRKGTPFLTTVCTVFKI